MCENFGCLRSWRYFNYCLEFLSRTGISRLWRNWAGYCCLSAWDRVITLSVAVVCERLRLAIGPRFVASATLGGGRSTVCGTLELVRCATGSYFSLIDGIIGADGETLDFWMTILGRKSWGWTLVGHRIGCSIERHRVYVGGGVAISGTFAKGSAGWDHLWMAWWSACNSASLLLHAMVGASCKVHMSVVTPWTMRSIGIMSDRVRWWCLNSTVSETWSVLVDLYTMVWHRYCWSATPTFQLAVLQKSHEFLVPIFLWSMMVHPKGPSGAES